jgi:hypothetical protein
MPAETNALSAMRDRLAVRAKQRRHLAHRRAVKVAASINAADQAEAIKALEARLESLVLNVSSRTGGR